MKIFQSNFIGRRASYLLLQEFTPLLKAGLRLSPVTGILQYSPFLGGIGVQHGVFSDTALFHSSSSLFSLASHVPEFSSAIPKKVLSP